MAGYIYGAKPGTVTDPALCVRLALIGAPENLMRAD